MDPWAVVSLDSLCPWTFRPLDLLPFVPIYYYWTLGPRGLGRALELLRPGVPTTLPILKTLGRPPPLDPTLGPLGPLGHLGRLGRSPLPLNLTPWTPSTPPPHNVSVVRCCLFFVAITSSRFVAYTELVAPSQNEAGRQIALTMIYTFCFYGCRPRLCREKLCHS